MINDVLWLIQQCLTLISPSEAMFLESVSVALYTLWNHPIRQMKSVCLFHAWLSCDHRNGDSQNEIKLNQLLKSPTIDSLLPPSISIPIPLMFFLPNNNEVSSLLHIVLRNTDEWIWMGIIILQRTVSNANKCKKSNSNHQIVC